MESKVKKPPLSISLKIVFLKVLYWKKLMEVLLKFLLVSSKFLSSIKTLYKSCLTSFLRNQKILAKYQNWSSIELTVQSPLDKSIFFDRSEKLTNSRYLRFFGLVQF